MRITVLGCGSSGGVPLVGCPCAVCQSSNAKNKRTRVSILVETQGRKLLIDTSPDLRQQCLRHNLCSVDAILYTHAHADHCHGIDDVRSLNYHRNAAIPIYGDPATLVEIRQRFPYIFKPRAENYGWYKPALIPQEICSDGAIQVLTVEGIEILAFPQWHGDSLTLGFRIGGFAYSTDVNRLPEMSLEVLKGLKVWLVDCLRYQPSPTHAHLEMTLGWIQSVRPERAILTHLAHEMDYDTLAAQLPDGVEPAFDGMDIHVS